MKKIISCGLIASGLIIFPGAAMEENQGAPDAAGLMQLLQQLQEQIDLKDQEMALKEGEISRIKQRLENVTEEKEKEEATKKALQRDLAARTEEQREQKELLDAILTQYQDMVGQYNVLVQAGIQNAVPVVEDNPPANNLNYQLTNHQQQLYVRWLQNEIGEKAWSALGGDHFLLANKLLQVIQNYPGKRVEISDLQVNFLKVSVDGKNQGKIHKF